MFVGKKRSSKGAMAVQLLSVHLLPFRPATPFEGPLRLKVLWVYPWGCKHRKKDRARGEIPCATSPDCDNLSKSLCDILGKQGFYNDDGQIADLQFGKRYGDRPRIEIEIERMR